MKKIPLYFTLLAGMLAFSVPAKADNEQEQVNQAADIIKRFKSLPERSIFIVLLFTLDWIEC